MRHPTPPGCPVFRPLPVRRHAAAAIRVPCPGPGRGPMNGGPMSARPLRALAIDHGGPLRENLAECLPAGAAWSLAQWRARRRGRPRAGPATARLAFDLVLPGTSGRAPARAR